MSNHSSSELLQRQLRKQFRRGFTWAWRNFKSYSPSCTAWSSNPTPCLSYIPQLGDMNNTGLIFNLHLAKDKGTTGYTAPGLQRPTTIVFLWRTVPGFPWFTMLLKEPSLVLSCSPTSPVSKHEVKPLLANDGPTWYTQWVPSAWLGPGLH